MNASLSSIGGSHHATNFLSGPSFAGRGVPPPNSGGIYPSNVTHTRSVHLQPARRHSVPYLGQKNQSRDENDCPVAARPPPTQAVSGKNHSVDNSLWQESQPVWHPTVSAPATCTTASSQHGHSSIVWPAMQADTPYQRNPEGPFYRHQRPPFVPLDNISEAGIPNCHNFLPFYLLPDTELQGINTSMTSISTTPCNSGTQNTAPVIGENADRDMQYERPFLMTVNDG
ncbi:uncharacterized protein BT62DRAFT_927332 [Guyanagaster necrorhizus]|uniref:Uncharacterized protein n=1 Tax=Guyanagaster necrorhizus TaxID=856835 RepID=A0A9P8AXB8_9AGAR|nr:uncharacterized protein BT62DRAFT_927332 [Guyanagaster necrorhizus MCA 3950]KAG7451609.1 hypothetical protein BT62DRAFT_927332 [Guyanagaster necrorhizus MCA 3950]